MSAGYCYQTRGRCTGLYLWGRPNGRCHTLPRAGISWRSCLSGTPSAAAAPHRSRRLAGQSRGSWGRRSQRPLKTRRGSAAAFPKYPPRTPAGMPAPACRTDRQTGDRAGWQLSAFFYFWLHSDSPLSLTFSLARCFSLAAAFCFMADRVFRMEGRSSRFSFLAVNSLNACSRLSACLVLKITI